jgi:3-dehydroquinate dehydratase I
MICLAISEKNLEKCLSLLEEVELAEIRLDLTDFSVDEINTVFNHSTPTIATCRPDKMGAKDQMERLTAAIKAGATYIDIEIETERKQQKTIIEIARQYKCKVIISYHNFEKTPGLKELYSIVDQCYDLGADIAKLATLCNSLADSARLLSLYSNSKALVAFGMGDYGKITRIVAPLLGAEFTFAAMDEGDETAPGQIGYSKMKKILDILNTEIN